jgi:hypothetical protein
LGMGRVCSCARSAAAPLVIQASATPAISIFLMHDLLFFFL